MKMNVRKECLNNPATFKRVYSRIPYKKFQRPCSNLDQVTILIIRNSNIFSFRTRTQFFQILCEEVMNKATKLIDVDKIFLAKSNEGAVYVLNALKLCLYWKTINEYIMDIYDDHFDIELYEGNMFGSIMAFIRHSGRKLIIPFGNSTISEHF